MRRDIQNILNQLRLLRSAVSSARSVFFVDQKRAGSNSQEQPGLAVCGFVGGVAENSSRSVCCLRLLSCACSQIIFSVLIQPALRSVVSHHCANKQ